MRPIYLDHAATTPLRSEAREAMAPYLEARFGNPSSVHRWGREARLALEESRERIAAALGASRQEIVFTAGGTEADNLAVLGRYRAVRRNGTAGAVACSAVEHKAVLGAVRMASEEGARALVLGVDGGGRVLVDALTDVLALRPAVVSLMWGNNEVGTLQPVAEVAERCRAASVVLHTDAVQAIGKDRVRVDEVNCDLLSLSAHKIGGPRGVGVLYVRRGVELAALMSGGGQEGGLRPGTENVAAAAGCAAAVELAAAQQETEAVRLQALRDRLEAGLRERVPALTVNGGGSARLPHILNVSLDGVDPEAILMALDLEGIAASSGSACQSGSVEPSHVLVAMGRVIDAADEGTHGGRGLAASVRLSLGRDTTEQEVDEAIERIPPLVSGLRSLADG